MPINKLPADSLEKAFDRAYDVIVPNAQIYIQQRPLDIPSSYKFQIPSWGDPILLPVTEASIRALLWTHRSSNDQIVHIPEQHGPDNLFLKSRFKPEYIERTGNIFNIEIPFERSARMLPESLYSQNALIMASLLSGKPFGVTQRDEKFGQFRTIVALAAAVEASVLTPNPDRLHELLCRLAEPRYERITPNNTRKGLAFYDMYPVIDFAVDQRGEIAKLFSVFCGQVTVNAGYVKKYKEEVSKVKESKEGETEGERNKKDRNEYVLEFSSTDTCYTHDTRPGEWAHNMRARNLFRGGLIVRN